MQSVEIVRNTVAAGRRVRVGEVLELNDSDASLLLSMGKAVPVADVQKVEHREEDLEKKMSKKAASKKKTKE